jgi:hypothetical protein
MRKIPVGVRTVPKPPMINCKVDMCLFPFFPIH